jgi:hypothetical protein
MMDKVALGLVFSEYFVSPASPHYTEGFTLIFIYHPGLVR